MTLRAVVPVLPATGRLDGLPVAAVRLHGRPLFVHAARTLQEVAGQDMVVSAPRSARRSVLAALAAHDLAGTEVVEAGDLLGDVLAAVLAPPPAAGVLVHDPRCPLTPASCLREVMAVAARNPDAVVVASRPVTDTVKVMVDGLVQANVERDRLRLVASPLVLPAALLARLAATGELQACADIDHLLALVRAAGGRLLWVAAPSTARRVSDAAAVGVLECLTEVREGRPA